MWLLIGLLVQSLAINPNDIPEIEFLSAKTLFVITDQGSEEFIIGNLEGISTDRNGNVYLYEQRRGIILVFDRNGEFQRQFGRLGRGPGEFQNLSTVFPMTDGNLLIPDNMNAKLTVYTPEGELVREIPWLFGSQLPIRNIMQSEDGKLYFNIRSTPYPDEDTPYYIIQETDDQIERVSNSFVDRNRVVFNSSSEILEQHFSIDMGISDMIISDGYVYIMPRIFDGIIYRFGLDDNPEPVSIPTHTYSEAYEPIPIERVLSGEVTSAVNVISGPEGRFTFYINNFGGKLLKYDENYLISFSFLMKDDRPELVADVIEINTSRIVGRQYIERLGDISIANQHTRFGEKVYILLGIRHIDDENRIYISRTNEDGYTEIHVLQLEIDFGF